ncbi:hypothetical protein QVD17_02685 [Tagetes erecta]|uniref:Uncharacterized protein n=1 Tax=Tagetes erecta TaxID=13708 RepID=A0AAD8LD84_TARER|nr:hypothetical protein QVD17_02685 [Tagetes erecta]
MLLFMQTSESLEGHFAAKLLLYYYQVICTPKLPFFVISSGPLYGLKMQLSLLCHCINEQLFLIFVFLPPILCK